MPKRNLVLCLLLDEIWSTSRLCLLSVQAQTQKLSEVVNNAVRNMWFLQSYQLLNLHKVVTFHYHIKLNCFFLSDTYLCYS